jgi:hypothetical protein
VVYIVFAGLFYCGGLLIENGTKVEIIPLEDGTSYTKYTIDPHPEDVFIALFAIFFGAS